MFQVFQMFQRYVAIVFVKVDRDVAYVAMVIHVCCKGLLTMFHLCFGTYIASVFLCICFSFTHMIHVFYLDVVYVCKGFQVFFRCFFFKCFKSMLQVCISNVSVISNICCRCFI
jgi:hypothetical protein